MNKIAACDMVVPNIHLLTVEAPGMPGKLQAGHFVMVRADEFGERIPLTVADWDEQAGTVTCALMQAGRSTRKLAAMKAGDRVSTFVGPLGKPLQIEKFGTVVCAGGCYGIGSIYPAARAMKAAGNRVITLIEARGRYLVYWEDKLREASDVLMVSTSDGSTPCRGRNSDRLRALIGDGEEIHRVIAMGCTFMMADISETTRPSQIPTRVSLNTVMVDGTGMCGACRVEVDGSTRFACVDGPDFDGHAVNWDLLRTRRRAYYHQETISEER